MHAVEDRVVWRWRKLSEAQDWSVQAEAEVHLAPRGASDQPPAHPGSGSPESSPHVGEAGSPEWVGPARRRLAEGEYEAAAAAVPDAVQPSGVEECHTLVRIALGRGDVPQARQWALRGLEIAPDDPLLLCLVAVVAEADGQWEDALHHFRRAGGVDPADPLPQLGIGSVQLASGRFEEAAAWLHQVYARTPQRSAARFYCASALVAAAASTPRVQAPGGRVVTSPDEIAVMRQLVGQAAALRCTERWIAERLHSLSELLRQVERRTFCPPGLSRLLGGRPVLDQIAGAVVVVLLLMVVVGGLRTFAEGQAVGMAVGLAGLLALQVLGYASWVPLWKANARRYGGRQRRPR